MSKYPRTYHLPYSLSITNDDRVSKSVDSLIGIDIVITEKIDGENTGVTRDGVFARSHAAFTESTWSKEVRQLHSMIRSSIDEDVFLFGENMEGIHSIEYTKLTSYFYMFGVRDNNIWIPWESIEEYSFLLDIPTVPVLFKGVLSTSKELKELVESLVKQPSELGGQREGIVIRNAGMFHNDDFSENVVKWVRKGHVQTTSHWTRDWKKARLINP